MTSNIDDLHSKKQLFQWAYWLALITIFYNILEGIVSILFGVEDETIALFGFGLDSFVEVISGLGVFVMIKRIQHDLDEDRSPFERRALRITGTAFYLLTVGLIATAVINILMKHKPITTLWGIIVASISIITMWLLIHYKVRVGKQLGSDAILADANCTRACFYLSITLLIASLAYELTGLGWIDSIGALAIAVFAFREGRESFEKAAGKICSCSCKTSCATSESV